MRLRTLLQLFWAVGLLFLASRAGAAIFTVVNTNDSGAGSLRQAILNANTNSGPDTIEFQIPGGGVHTIAPTSALPTITDPVTIDGRTQPGWISTPLIELSGASAGGGVDGLHVISGSSQLIALAVNRFQPLFLGAGGNGIVLETGGSNAVLLCAIGTDPTGTIGLGNLAAGVLVLNSASNQIGQVNVAPPPVSQGNTIGANATGVLISGSGSNGNVIQANAIGVGSSSFTSDVGNAQDGVAVDAGNANGIYGNVIGANKRSGVLVSGSASATSIAGNSIGGLAPAILPNLGDGVQISGSSGNLVGSNTILGSGANGILLISGANGNLIEQNFVGVSAAGQVSGNAFNGIIASGADHNTIVGNVVGGNGTNGIRIRSGATGSVVKGNFVGIGSGGVVFSNFADGVQINDGAVQTTVGGTSTGAGNVISGNAANGVHLVDATTTGNTVLGNLIGTTLDGKTPRGNSGHGVFIETGSSNNGIGGTAAGSGNTIAFNGGAGIFVGAGTGNDLGGNSIRANAGLGIDLAPAGVTANDPGDADTGPNGLQNFPILLSQGASGGTRSVSGSLQSAPNASYRIDLYSSASCDPSGNGEGETFLGSTTTSTDASGTALFTMSASFVLPATLTATATDALGNTSEFSVCLPVLPSFHTLTPCRMVDTRGPDGPFGGPALAAGVERSFGLNPSCGIPATALALALNIAVTQPTGPGHLTVYPGPNLPSTATLNYSGGQTRANNAVVTLGPGTVFQVRPQQGSGTVHVVIDVSGYFE